MPGSWDNGGMIRPLALALAWRYLRAPTRNRFISFIGLVSVGGIALGVAALIVVISVMNGFEAELRSRLLRFDAQARLVSGSGMEDWRAVAEQVAEIPVVRSVLPAVEVEALLSSRRRYAGVRLLGVAPDPGFQSEQYAERLVAGSFGDLHGPEGGLALGRYLADQLGVRVGETVRILIPRPAAAPRLRDLPVRAVFLAGVASADSSLAIASLETVSALAGLDGRVRVLEIRGDDPYATPQAVKAWAATAAAAREHGLAARSWMERHEALFRTVWLERLAMGALLSAIIAVAVFNVLATLVMSVNERRGEIAILATLGAGASTIMAAFCLQGLLAGLVGVASGAALGIWLTRNVDAAMQFLERLFDFIFLPPETYYLTGVPAQLSPALVLWVAGLGLTLSALASWYPARRAAQVDPAGVLRYE